MAADDGQRTFSDFQVCQWVNQAEALRHFAIYDGKTQSQQHIKPLHWYVACRLVLEGGFHPDEITPHPPFTAIKRGGQNFVHFDPAKATGGETTVLGGLKTKKVDVVVNKGGIGPVLAISCKGMTGAFRNLTNRMEETVGECTNLHITYPALVFGYFFILRANRDSSTPVNKEKGPVRAIAPNDVAVDENGWPVESISRFHGALTVLTGRHGIRDDASRYEAVSLAMIEMQGGDLGQPFPGFPPSDSPLRLEQFFNALYLRYDERYVYSAPDLKSTTRRLEWEAESPVFTLDMGSRLDYDVRLSAGSNPNS